MLREPLDRDGFGDRLGPSRFPSRRMRQEVQPGFPEPLPVSLDLELEGASAATRTVGSTAAAAAPDKAQQVGTALLQSWI